MIPKMDIYTLKSDLERDEGVRLRPYRDSVGKLTIGCGRNLDDLGITRQEAFHLMGNDINRTIADLDRALPWWRGLTEARQRGLANMCFNLGLPKLLGFRKMLVALREGEWEDAAAEALDSKWARQVGRRADRIASAFRGGPKADNK